MSHQHWQNIFVKKIGRLVKDYGDLWTIEFDDTIEADNPANYWYQCKREAFARFRCSKCKKDWTSKKVLVVFHFHLTKRTKKGTVKVHHFRQECKTCQDAEMEKPVFTTDDIKVLLEKVVERIRFKCYRESRPDGYVPSRPVEKSDSPHEAAHCEACLKGVCSNLDRNITPSGLL